MRTALTDLVGVRHPVVQTGMGWVAGPRLVSATANAGYPARWRITAAGTSGTWNSFTSTSGSGGWRQVAQYAHAFSDVAAYARTLDASAMPAPYSRPHREERAVNGTSTRRASAERPGGWWKPGGDGGEWTREPPDRTAAQAAPSRLRRRAPAIQGSADRDGHVPTPSVRQVRHRRMRVAPRKARPFVPGR